MEYKILGLSENATVEEAEKALHKIRKQCRAEALTSLPDIERVKNKHYLDLSEESFQRICQKRKVNDALSSLSLAPFMQNPFDIVDNIERHMSDLKKGKPGSVQTSSYSYQNINGNVSGTINGRPMTDVELKRQRQPMNSRFLGF